MIGFNRDLDRWPLHIFVTFFAAILLSTCPSAEAQNYQVDEYGSKRVTHYLHRHDFPLVGAQILDNNNGGRELHLYGFVATQYGQQDAAQKAFKYLGDPTIKIVNSIQINQSIESMRPLSPELPQAANTPVPPPSNSKSQWDKAIDNIYKNGAQPLPQPSGPLMP